MKILVPKRSTAWKPCQATLESLEDAALVCKASRPLDSQSPAALRSQIVERLVPSDVVEYVRVMGAGRQNQSFELGAFLD